MALNKFRSLREKAEAARAAPGWPETLIDPFAPLLRTIVELIVVVAKTRQTEGNQLRVVSTMKL